MKNLLWLVALVVVVSFGTESSQAARADRRQGNQRARVRQGVESGELTKGEAARARAGQRHIQRMENRAKADGSVSDEESAKLENAQDKASARIYRMKHNKRQR